MSQVRTKLQAVLDEVNAIAFEKTQFIQGVAVALVARKHLLEIGPPGSAKSFVIELITQRIGARLYDTMLSRDLLPDALFGPLNVVEFQKGKYQRVSADMLQEAEVAFLDEIFKCNSTTLNALLGVMNERVYKFAGQKIRCPLVSVVSASNELPQGEDLAALYDRLHLRFWVPYIQDEANWQAMITAGDAPPPVSTITLQDLVQAQAEARAVKVTPDTLKSLSKIKLECAKAGIKVSDRRWKDSVAILRAQAWLSGHDEVKDSDLSILVNVLWSSPEERKKVSDLVLDVSCPELKKALEFLDQAAEQHTIAKQDPSNANVVSEAFKKLKSISDSLDKIAKNGGGTVPQVQEAMAKVKTYRKDVGQLVLGS